MRLRLHGTALTRSACLLVGLTPVLLSGCHSATAEQTPQAQAIDSIIRQTGGDWTKLAPAEHDRLVKEIGNGNERTAQMNFSGRWARLQGGKAMPPRPGGGPP